jgi:Zn-dependent M28 family amino/carboxypeptidase
MAVLDGVSEAELRRSVGEIARPRSFGSDPTRNRATADWLMNQFSSFGYRVQRQGRWSNILALPTAPVEKAVLVGAHYDSVPMSPGADDNASAVAAMLGCAAACSRMRPVPAVAFAAFNREEDGLLGSRDFVETFLPQAPFSVSAAHILEMVGYASSKPGSQRVPTGLSIKMPDTGDFLGLLANGRSATAMNHVLRKAAACVPGLEVIGLSVRFGLERFLPVLARSDHAPFWSRKIPAVMWTDTSEFRNPHYHRLTDTPDTLDYRFLRRVTQLLTASVA